MNMQCTEHKQVQNSTVENIVVWKGIPALEFVLSCGHHVFVETGAITFETWLERHARKREAKAQ